MQPTVTNISQARKATAMQAGCLHRAAVQASGLPALSRLVAIAQRDTGQGRIVGRFLLGLYNGPEYPFALTELRALDHEIHSDCLAVLMMDWAPEREVHELIDDGQRIWAELARIWGAQ